MSVFERAVQPGKVVAGKLLRAVHGRAGPSPDPLPPLRRGSAFALPADGSAQSLYSKESDNNWRPGAQESK